MITVQLTREELSYLILLVSAEADMDSESQHLPKESDEYRALTAMQKLSAAIADVTGQQP